MSKQRLDQPTRPIVRKEEERAAFAADSLTCVHRVQAQLCGDVCIWTGLAAYRMFTSHPVWFCSETASAGAVCLGRRRDGLLSVVVQEVGL